ncbi:MAG: hypothetical protein P4L87_03130, partial [Formivibrio sp.]|nr:hypothetical protein [Formivibrio sp.]
MDAIRRKIPVSEDTPFGRKVVFIDLEWHQLNEKQPIDMTKPEGAMFLRSNIAQICAISADYSIKFNQYVSYKPLAREWQNLVQWGFMEHAKQDDPKVAIPFERCMELFIKAFVEGTLFLHYGSTDGKSIFRSLAAKFDVSADGYTIEIPEDIRKKRAELTRKMEERDYRWANIQHWMKASQQSEPFNKAEIKVGGALHTLYDNLFHRPLLLKEKNDTPSLLDATRADKWIDKKIRKFPDNIQQGLYGYIPKEWIEVKDDRILQEDKAKSCFPSFWPTSHLEPVWHVAHTDTIMMMNCVALIALLPEWMDAINTKEEVDEWKLDDSGDHRHNVNVIIQATGIAELVTTIVLKTGFFRSTRLALSERSARSIFEWFNESTTTQTSTELARKAAEVQTMRNKNLRDTPTLPPVRHRQFYHRAAKLPTLQYITNDVETPDSEDLFAKQFRDRAKLDETYQYIMTYDNGHAVIGVTKKSGQYADKVKAIRTFLIEKWGKDDPDLEHELVKTKHAFHEKRKARFPGEPDFVYDGKPWITSTSVSSVAPRTEILHTLQCLVFSDPNDPKKTR